MLKHFFAAAAAALLMTAGAGAADKPLTADAAKRFVASLDSIETLGKEFEAEGKADNLKVDTMPKAGEPFKPFSKSVAALKTQYPADYAKLENAVKPHGFSAEGWSQAGDQVMVAYVALRMQEENPQAMAQMQQMHAMDKSMLDQMPPEMKSQITTAMAMMDMVQNVSAEDKKAVAAVRDDLDAYVEKQAAKAGIDHSGHH